MIPSQTTPTAAVLAAPHVPRTFLAGVDDLGWDAALRARGLVPAQGDRGDLGIVSENHATLPSANTLVATDRRLRGLLEDDGMTVVGYRVEPAGYDSDLFVPEGRPVFGKDTPGSRLRTLVRRLVRSVRGRGVLLVATNGDSTAPAVLDAAGVRGRLEAIRVSRDPRRRAVCLLSDSQDGRPSLVIKAGFDRVCEERGEAEQQTMRKLHEVGLGYLVPEPLGSGRVDYLTWSVESFAPGTELHDALGRAGPAEGRLLLEQLASWLTDVATTTRRVHPETSHDAFRSVELRGVHSKMSPMIEEIADVPHVLVHRDLATGGNVLVNGAQLTVIDWETARWDGLPLLDLLPVLCFGLARANGHESTSDDAGTWSVELCAGERPESTWLFDQIRRYLAAASIPIEQAGRLAALAWGHQASMRLVHEELLAEAGLPPVRWTTGADVVAARWMEHPPLGTAWSALSDAART